MINKALGLNPNEYIDFTALKYDELRTLAERIKILIEKSNRKPTLGETIETSVVKALETYDGPIVSMLKEIIKTRTVEHE